jgi:hypothetical protein
LVSVNVKTLLSVPAGGTTVDVKFFVCQFVPVWEHVALNFDVTA